MRVLTTFIAALLIGFFVFSNEQTKDNFLNGKRPYVTMLTNPDGTHGGTGFYVTAPSGKVYTLTNGHVCGLAEKGVIYSRNTKVLILKVLSIYPDHDLCLVEAPSEAVGINVAFNTRVGDNIYVLGHPLLEPKSLVKGQMSGTVTIQVMQGYNIACEGKGFKKEPADPDDLMARIFGIKYACLRTLQSEVVTANILPGNSGSPILNAYGHLVGVAFAGQPGSGRGYIVPLAEIKKFLADK